MPVDFVLDKAHCIVRTRAWGNVTAHDFLENITRIKPLFADGTIDKTWSQIVDFRETDKFDINADQMRQLVLQSPWPVESRRAMIMSDEHAYGFGRMYQSMGNDSGDNILLVFTEEDAEKWVQG